MTRYLLSLCMLAALLLAHGCETPESDKSPGTEGQSPKIDDDTVVEYFEGLSDDDKTALMARLHSGPQAQPESAGPGQDSKQPESGDDEPAENAGGEENGDDSAAEQADSDLEERTGVTARGDTQLTLLGPDLDVGDTIPSFTLKTTDMEPFTEMDLQGKWAILSVVPSLDTPVCESQTTTLGSKVDEMPESSVFVTISRDLPFAQRRFSQTHPMDTVLVSDYQAGEFGKRLGVLVKETGLLARSVWLVNPDGEIVYRQIVADQGTEPDYEALMNAVQTNTAH